MSQNTQNRPAREQPPVRPEQVFFADPAIDRLMGVVMTLASEHYVLSARVKALEERLRAGGVAELAQGPADVAAVRAEQAEAVAFAEALLRPLLGLQEALGASGSFSLGGAGKGRG